MVKYILKYRHENKDKYRYYTISSEIEEQAIEEAKEWLEYTKREGNIAEAEIEKHIESIEIIWRE